MHLFSGGGDNVSLEALGKASNRVIGQKQTTKAVEKGLATVVYLALDAEEHVVQELRKKCQDLGVRVEGVESMSALGKACGIEVGAAAAALVKAKI